MPADEAPVEAVAATGAAASSSLGVPIADFNGDGRADLVVGVPGDDVVTPKGTLGDAGSIHVFYGDGTGLSTVNDQIWTQETSGVPSDAAVGERFGAAVAVGDFNGDHVSDLAIGAPGEGVGADINAGTITVLYGKAGVGLSADGAVAFDINVAARPDGVHLQPSANDELGSVLAAGDVDGDGFVDLVIGVPLADVMTQELQVDAGLVIVASRNRGASGFGRYTVVDMSVALDEFDQPRGVAKGDRFGAALAVGDFTPNGAADLAIGAPYADFVGNEDCGVVVTLDAKFAPEVTLADVRLFSQNEGTAYWEFPGGAEDGDHFGASLALGDFDGSGYLDLAIGVPDEDRGGNDAGIIEVLYNNGFSLDSLNGDEELSQFAAAVEGSAEDGDRFGAALIAGDFDGDGYEDLAIGVPGEKVSGQGHAGAVNVLYGRSSGLSALGDQFFAQDYDGLSGKPQPNEAFGSALGRGDFNTDGITDLVVGIPKDVVTALAGASGTIDVVAGEIEIIRGSSEQGLLTTGEVELHREQSGVAGVCEAGDLFGFSLGGG